MILALYNDKRKSIADQEGRYYETKLIRNNCPNKKVGTLSLKYFRPLFPGKEKKRHEIEREINKNAAAAATSVLKKFTALLPR